MSRKIGLGVDVLTAAQERISWVFDRFERICVSFSAGKDSTVLLHLVADEAKRRNRKFALLFIDWEAQFRATIEHAQQCFSDYADLVEPYWVALPITTTNAVSAIEPEWTAWDDSKRELWVREPPPNAITDQNYFPFYQSGMTFEEFVPAFANWYGGGGMFASLVGIRADESLNRFRTLIADKTKLEGRPWTTWLGGGLWNIYPIYDWSVDDIWTYHGRTGKPHNQVYDRMRQAGLTPHQMRICEPYGSEQRKGLWLYHLIEPDTWPKVCARVAGANSGALYALDAGNIQGNRWIAKPDHLTWESYAEFLLRTLPPKTAEHYRNKIAVYVRYCTTHYVGYEQGLPQELDGDTGGTDVASWRRVCRAILRNDYWCKSLSFSPTKSAAYDRYVKVMAGRRKKWGIFA